MKRSGISGFEVLKKNPYIDGGAGRRQTALSSGYNGLAAAVRERMAQALIAPKLASGGSAAVTAAGRAIWVRNCGERLPIRGGRRYNGKAAGLAAPYLNDRRVSMRGGAGFRPAFIS